jgi:hypothetical protein
MCSSRERKSLQQTLKRKLRSRHRCNPGFRHRKVAFGPPASLWSRIAKSRTDESLLFQAIKCGVESAGDGLTPGAFRNNLTDSYSICIVIQAKDRQKDHLFEFTELDWLRHLLCIVG